VSNAPFWFLVGLKCDLVSKAAGAEAGATADGTAPVAARDAIALAEELGAEYFEVSAKDGAKAAVFLPTSLRSHLALQCMHGVPYCLRVFCVDINVTELFHRAAALLLEDALRSGDVDGKHKCACLVILKVRKWLTYVVPVRCPCLFSS
jgi:hypothetical protein